MPPLEIRLKVNVTVFLATDLDVFSQGLVLWVLISHHTQRVSSVVGKHFPEGTIQHGPRRLRRLFRGTNVESVGNAWLAVN